MLEPFNPDALLFNKTFLRLCMLIPLIISIVITVNIWKQYRRKFKDVPLVSSSKAASNSGVEEENIPQESLSLAS